MLAESKVTDYTPNLRDSIIARNVESLANLGEHLGAYRGSHYSIDMTLGKTAGKTASFRLLPEIANYTQQTKRVRTQQTKGVR